MGRLSPRSAAWPALPGLLRDFHPRRGSFSGEVFESFVTNVAITVVTGISGLLLARLLVEPAKRGELAAIQALPMIVAALGQLGLNEAVVYFGGREPSRAGRLALSAGALILVAGVPIVLLSAWVTSWYLHGQAPNVVLASQLFLGVVFLNAIDGIAVNTARALHRITAWNLLRTAPPALWAVVIAVFYVLGLANPEAITFAFLLAYVPVSLGMVFFVRRQLQGAWPPDPALWPRLLRYGLPVATGAAPRLLNQRLDQLFVIGMLTTHDAGLYSIAVSWTNLVAMPGMALSTVAFSKIAGMPEAVQQWRFIRKATWSVAWLTGGTALLLGITTPLAMHLYGKGYVEATPVCWVLLLVGFVRNVAWMQQTAMQGVGRPGAVLVSQWIGFAVLLPAMLLLVPHHGVFGAAWALAAAAIATWIVVAWLLRRSEGGVSVEPPASSLDSPLG
jgi:enterobacterial common antigen flippase